MKFEISNQGRRPGSFGTGTGEARCRARVRLESQRQLKKMITFRLCIYCLLFILSGCQSAGEMNFKYKMNDTVVLTGVVRTGTYRSCSDQSEKEYFNTSYCFYLKKSIEVTDENGAGRRYADISHVEIQDPYAHAVHQLTGSTIKIKGILKTFIRRSGYYRQYSTPIQIDVIEIIQRKNSRNKK